MFCEPDYEMIRGLQAAGLSRKMVCKEVGIKYSKLNSYINGFSTMNAELRCRIMKLIEQTQVEKWDSAERVAV